MKKKNSHKKSDIIQSEKEDFNEDIIFKNKKLKQSNSNSESSDDDTERLDEEKLNNEDEIKKIIIGNYIKHVYYLIIMKKIFLRIKII